MDSYYDIVKQLDCDIKKMSYHDVCSAFLSLEKEEQASFEVQAELLGMSFVEEGGNKYAEWKCYYGPQTTWTNKDNGQVLYFPNIFDVSKEHIAYWIKRSKETKNPLLQMRYTGLVWEMQKRIVGSDPDFNEIKIQHIASSIDVINKDLAVHVVLGLVYAKRAIEKSISIRNKMLTDSSIEAMLLYAKKYQDDESVRIWGGAFNIFLKHLNMFGKYEEEMVNDMLERFNRIESRCMANRKKSDGHIHILKDVSELLADYYNKKSKNEKILEFLGRYHVCLSLYYDLESAIWSHQMIEQLQQLYRKYNFLKEANKLYLEIQALGSLVRNEVATLRIPITIDKDKIEAHCRNMLEGSDEEVIEKFIVTYLPNLSAEKRMQKQEAEYSPFCDKIRTGVYNHAGLPINNVGVGKHAEDQKFRYGMYRHMQLISIFLQLDIQKMKENQILTYEKTLELFKDSQIILESQRPLLERGLKAYFDNDYLVACHLLIPLFEGSIRNLASAIGIEVLRANKNSEDGNEYVSLESLMKNIVEQNPDLKDVFVYFSNLFTDKYGWNARNLICHGAFPANKIDNTFADRIFHAILLLSKIYFKKID